MKFEYSAGGIVFRREKASFHIVVCKPTGRDVWVFPKGLIGDHHKHEGKEETAVREVEEEAGVKAKIIAALTPVTYWYNWEEEQRKKTVYFYVMEYISGDIRTHDWEMSDVQWVPIETIATMLSYASDKAVWQEAKEKIERL